MGPKTTELVAVIDQLASFLDEMGESHWTTWIREDVQWIRGGDFRGVEHFLSAFGGMGSLNDFVLHPKNGHALDESETESANLRLRALLSAAYEMADEVRRLADTSAS